MFPAGGLFDPGPYQGVEMRAIRCAESKSEKASWVEAAIVVAGANNEWSGLNATPLMES